ncbi:MAG TPA: class I SAM-dependent methyltransferase [Myxococcaceae bacterium]|nr:class I SAM-dependent methyltransferase [Myxococcaceae bacterium]
MTASPLATPMPWNLLASAYETETLPSFRPFAEEALRLAGPMAGSTLADVACGPGTLALLAADAGFTVDAIDFSPEMIALLERSARERGLDGIRARVGDGQALPYPDATHGGAFSLFGLMFFPDRARGFSELRRILQPGARAVISSWQPMDRSRTLSALSTAAQQALPSGAAPPAQPALVTAEACRAEMEQAFEEVQVHPRSIDVQFPSSDALWDSMERAMPPLVLTRHQLGEQAWAPVSSRIRELLARSLGTGPLVLDLHALLTVGTAPGHPGAGR